MAVTLTELTHWTARFSCLVGFTLKRKWNYKIPQSRLMRLSGEGVRARVRTECTSYAMRMLHHQCKQQSQAILARSD